MSYERMHGDGPCHCYERFDSFDRQGRDVVMYVPVDRICGDCGVDADEGHSCPLPGGDEQPGDDYLADEQDAAYERWKADRED